MRTCTRTILPLCWAIGAAMARAEPVPRLPAEFTFSLECRTTNAFEAKGGFGGFSMETGSCCPEVDTAYKNSLQETLYEQFIGNGGIDHLYFHLTISSSYDPASHLYLHSVNGEQYLDPQSGSRVQDVTTNLNPNPTLLSSPIYAWTPSCEIFFINGNCIPQACASAPKSDETNTCTMQHVAYRYATTNESGFDTCNSVFHNEVSNPLTTGELIQIAKDRAEATLPERWVPCGKSTPSAGVTIGYRELDVTCSAVKARFKVFCPATNAFSISYDLCRTYYTNCPACTNAAASNDCTLMFERTNMPPIEGIGTGDWQVFEVDLPFATSACSNNGCVYYKDSWAWIEVGCASATASGCASCTETPGTVAAALTDAGPLAHINLGPARFGRGAGALVLAASRPSAALASAGALALVGDLTGAELLYETNTLRQVKGELCLADIRSTNAGACLVRFFTEYGGLIGGFYDVVESNAFATVTIATGATTNQLIITENTGTARQYVYEWSEASSTWALTSGNGARKETRSWSQVALARTNSVFDAALHLVSQKLDFYASLGTNGLALVRRVVGPTGPALTSQWGYYDNPATDGASYGKLKLSIEPTGFWQRFEYDQAGRLAKQVSQFLNGPTNAADAQSRVVQWSYVSLGGTNASETRVETLVGQEIAREYTLYLPTGTRNIRCATAGAAWTNADNLVTDTGYVLSGPFAGRLKSVRHPDGTLGLHDYTTNYTELTTTVWSGVPDASGAGVVDGTQTTTTVGTGGEPLSRTTADILTGLVTAQETYTYNDPLNNSHTVGFLDGSSELAQYGCCGLELTQDRDGTLTFFHPDALKRQTASTRNGITLTNVLDAVDRVLMTIRIGTNNVQTTNRMAAYDLAGRVLAETNALGGPTTHSYDRDPATGEAVNTTTYPDGGTRIERHYQDGSIKEVTGTAVHPERYLYGVDADGPYTTRVLLAADGGSNEWVQTSNDLLGRPFKVRYADGAVSRTFYNSQGQPWKEVDPDGVTRLGVYNARGEREYSLVALSQTATNLATYEELLSYLDDLKAGTDRITRTVSEVFAESGWAVRRTRVYGWTNVNEDSPLLLATTEAYANGSLTRTITPAGTSTTATTRPGGGIRQTISTAPDGSDTVATWEYGRPQSVARRAPGGTQLMLTTYGQDELGRQNQVSELQPDSTFATTTWYFNAADQRSGSVSPVPGPGQSPQVTSNYFDTAGRLWKTTLPDNTSVTNEYFPTGLLKKRSGSREYPVEYSYEAQGRVKTMTTWRAVGDGATAATTTWNYNPHRGWLDNKRYADNTGPDYSYHPSGRLKERFWARGSPQLKTTYGYNPAGDLATVDYSDSTPDVAYGYDRLGRQRTVTQGGAVTTRQLGDGGQLLSESYAGGPLDGLTLTNSHDEYLRRTNVAVLGAQGAVLASAAYTYGWASRLETVSDGTNTATYSYLANSMLVAQIEFAHGGATTMSTTRQYDRLYRLTDITTVDSQNAPLSSFAYVYNSANQRTRRTDLGGAYWVYEYDLLGQVKAGKRFWADGTPVAGQQFEYAFDDIGNRQTAASGGDQWGGHLRYQGYTANALNQYESRTVPGYLDVMGSAHSNATVTVNEQSAYRKGDYFRAELPLNNATGAVWLSITNLAVLNTTTNDLLTNILGHALVAATPETFAYDADGNLTQDGKWNYTWDAENRLVAMTNIPSVPQSARKALIFAYDSQGRRVQKTVYTNNGGGYVASYTNCFVCDGWNVVAEVGPGCSVIRSYAWGTDLSGSLQGAGGVGGLLAMTVPTGSSAETYFYCFDGSGNVSTLVSAADGAAAADYAYGPFGEVLRATYANPLVRQSFGGGGFRFSTKYQDDETDLLYYGFRYYSVSTGRWLSRDVIAEEGGMNIYAFLDNAASNGVDFLGLGFSPPEWPGEPAIPIAVEDLEYSSDGETYSNGPLRGGWDEEASASGRRSDTIAWFIQDLRIRNCPNGLCNSSIDPEHGGSTFITAQVKNNSKCRVCLTCSCVVYWTGMTWVPRLPSNAGARHLGGFGSKGSVLDTEFNHWIRPSVRTTGWIAQDSGTENATKYFCLHRGETRLLYKGYMTMSLPGHVGSIMNSAMNGNCFCTRE